MMTVTAYDAHGMALGQDLEDGPPSAGCTILITAAGVVDSIVWGVATVYTGLAQYVSPGETLTVRPVPV